MSAIPRVGFVLALLVLAFSPPMATASSCVEVGTATYGDGLRIIAATGRQIALGFTAGPIGEGVGAVLIITPTLCGGVGIGNSVPGTASPSLQDSPVYPLLP